ncbi:MAG: MFS transporter [Bdellovibrionales bacterium]
MSRNFLTLWLGQLVSLLGSGLTGFAVSLWVYEQTQSPYWLSIAVFAKLMPNIYLSLFAGHLVDRFPLKNVIAGSNLILLVLTILAGTLLRFDLFNLSALMMFLFLTGAVESALGLAFQSSTALLARPEFFMRSQGLVALIENGPLILAPVLGVIAYEKMGFKGILWMDAISYVLALFALKTVSFPEIPARAKQSWGAGIHKILGHPQLRHLQLHFCWANFFHGLLAGLVAALVLTATAGDKKSLAMVNTLSAVGLTLGALLVLLVPLKRRLGSVIAGGTLIGAIAGRILVGASGLIGLWAVGLAIRQLMMPVINSANQTLWVQLTAPEERGVVFGARRLLSQGLYPLAVFLGGALSAVPNGPSLGQLFLIIGLLEALVSLVAFWRLRQF